jgi:hypothetical protein
MEARNLLRRMVVTGAALFIGLAASALFPQVSFANGLEFTSEFRLEDCRFEDRSNFKRADNPHFPLKPGYQLVLEGMEDGELIRVEITVLQQTENLWLEIDGELRKIKTRVVEERESADGELKEVSRNFFAICRNTNDIFYFGEDVDDYEDGMIVGHGGAWRAGVDGATPGIIMPGRFLLGSRYFQEMALGIAEDRGENVEMGLEVVTPAGTFFDCVRVVETSPLDAGAESEKTYCPNVGLVVDDVVTLVEINQL